ncbi:MAG: hypothetical protein ACU0CA_08645 [Paracoccaceae bacterium]
MTHKFNVSRERRTKIANGSQNGIFLSTAHWLSTKIREGYPDPSLFGGIVDPSLYVPVDETNEVEAAIFAAAWKTDSRELICRFGIDGIVSLFQRFNPYGLVADRFSKKKIIQVFRGTNPEEYDKDPGGMSWTTSKEMARRFAFNKGSHEPISAIGSLKVSEILMALKADKEFEVVVCPGSVEVTSFRRHRWSQYSPPSSLFC